MSDRNKKNFVDKRSLKRYAEVSLVSDFDLEVHYQDYERMSLEDQTVFVLMSLKNKVAGAMYPNRTPLFPGRLSLSYAIEPGRTDFGNVDVYPCLTYSEPNRHELDMRVLVGITNSTSITQLPGYIHHIAYFDSKMGSVMTPFKQEFKIRAKGLVNVHYAYTKDSSQSPF